MNKENIDAMTFSQFQMNLEIAFENFIEYHAEQYLEQLSQNKDYVIQDYGWIQFPYSVLLGGLKKRFPSHKIQLEKSWRPLEIYSGPRATYRFYSNIEN